MAHVRRQIRDAVVKELSMLAEAGYMVSGKRVTSLDIEELPAVLVAFSPSEESAAVTLGHAPTLERLASMTITGIVKDDDPYLDDLLEEVAEQIESAVTQTHNGLAKSTILASTSKEYDTLGDVPVAAISLVFSVNYHTSSNAPSIPI